MIYEKYNITIVSKDVDFKKELEVRFHGESDNNRRQWDREDSADN